MTKKKECAKNKNKSGIYFAFLLIFTIFAPVIQKRSTIT